MRKITLLALICVAGFIPAVAQAGIYTFQPDPVDLYDLDHYKYYTWGINWSIPQDEIIQTASLFIDNINDWIVEEGDILYIHLLDNPASGVTTFTDDQGGGDNFAGQGILLTTYTDNDGGPNPPEDLTYNFTSSEIGTLATYIGSNNNNSNFGLGIDPDCHYFNDGITLTVTTGSTPVPEPSIALLGLMTPVLFLFMRKRRVA